MPTRTLTLTPAVRAVLEESEIGPHYVKLRSSLKRDLYVAVNAALLSAGGRWDKRAKAHLFTGNPRESLGLILEKGEFVAPVDPVKVRQQELQAYYTPAKIAENLAALAGVRGCTVLEPSCGPGALVRACVEAGASAITIVEVDTPAYFSALDYLHTQPRISHGAYNRDFLTLTTGDSGIYGHDRVVMNPPFADGKDFQHICHALKFVSRPGGTLTSVIMGDSNIAALEAKVTRGIMGVPISFDYKVWPLPENTFKESGTGAQTAVIQISNLRHRAISVFHGMFLPMLDWTP